MYAPNPQVMQISGHMFPIEFDNETDAIFLPFITSWGWATWQRAWKLFDPNMSSYDQIRNNKKLKYAFNLYGSYNYSDMMDAQMRGEIDSWAIRWYMTTFLNNGLTLYPVKTLVENMGFDGSGVHCPMTLNTPGLFSTAPLHNFPQSIMVEQKNLDKVISHFKTLHKKSTIFSFLEKIRFMMSSLCRK
jgi:hypothetical protein